ncbi:MAG: SDR family oxidoreductase [Steroidobacteraceae bacterium]
MPELTGQQSRSTSLAAQATTKGEDRARRAGESPKPKRVLVTGASSGIGAAVSSRMAADGAELVLLGRDEEKLRRVRDALAPGTKVRSYPVDFSDAGGLAPRIRNIASELSGLDAIVHSAGIFLPGSAIDGAHELLDRMLQINVHAAMLLTRIMLPYLEDSRGTIVFINSSGVLRPQRISAEYMACKHALQGLTNALREEVNSRGIRVTSIYPGRTATPMQESVHVMEGSAYHPERLLQPADIAELVACAVNLPSTAELVDVIVRPLRCAAGAARPLIKSSGSIRE